MYLKEIVFFLKVSKTCFYVTVIHINTILDLRISSACPTVETVIVTMFPRPKINYINLLALKFKMPLIFLCSLLNLNHLFVQ